MRRIALCAMTALLVPAAGASAQTTVDVDSHINPVVRLFSPKTTPSTLDVNLKFHGPNGELADPLQQAILKFSYGAKLNGSKFPSCTLQRMRDNKPCPKGSQIGGGETRALINGDPPFEEIATVTMFNGPKGKSILFRIKVSDDQPVPLDVPFEAPLQTHTTGMYNYTLTVNVPESLQRQVGLNITIDYFNVKVGATRKVKGKKVGYIETLICPPGALVPLQADFGFLEAPTFHTDTYIHCGA